MWAPGRGGLLRASIIGNGPPDCRNLLKAQAVVISRAGREQLLVAKTANHTIRHSSLFGPFGGLPEGLLYGLTGLAACQPLGGLLAEAPPARFYRVSAKMANLLACDGVLISKNRHNKEFSC